MAFSHFTYFGMIVALIGKGVPVLVVPILIPIGGPTKPRTLKQKARKLLHKSKLKELDSE